jgi:hypothetical protein
MVLRDEGSREWLELYYKHAVSTLPIIALIQRPSLLVELQVLHFAR